MKEIEEAVRRKSWNVLAKLIYKTNKEKGFHDKQHSFEHMAIVFNKLIGRSFLIDLFAIVMIVLGFIMQRSKLKAKVISKEELVNELKEEI